uniref:Uncharacterized protein n=1 Tax=Equus asinus asinus TaxID=83772 RepID=A0A8C4L4R3_EQUAS
MCCIMTFQSTTDHIYDGGPLRITFFSFRPSKCKDIYSFLTVLMETVVLNLCCT